MNRISYPDSALMFNQRVLTLGRIDEEFYGSQDLRQSVFFNRVFHTNTDELFRNDKINITKYLISMRDFRRNIGNALKHLPLGKDNFERRLATERRIKNQLISRYTPFDRLSELEWTDGQLYYLSKMSEGVIISEVDPRSSIYQTPITYRYDQGMKFAKTDECIRTYLDHEFGKTITLCFTLAEKDQRIVKIEYAGDRKLMKEVLTHLNGAAALVLENPYLFLEDILQMIGPQEETETPLDLSGNDDSFTLADLFQKDMIIEYPIDSFDLYLRFLHLASIDPEVKSISLTLYRIGDNPTLYYLLRDAVQRGVEVNVNLELDASNEEINLFWSIELKEAGVNVLHYGHGYSKVHAKVTLIEFRDQRMLAQVGTGNFHWQTTNTYTDLSYLTANPLVCQSVQTLFRLLRQEENFSPSFSPNLLVSPYNAREEIIKLIRQQSNLGGEGYVVLKCNSLDDLSTMVELEKAAENNCQIELIIRGVCTWYPARFLNQNVTIRSIIWDKLEHSRLYQFGRKTPIIYLGSLDLVTNKIDQRIESMVRIDDKESVEQLLDYLAGYLEMDSHTWLMVSDSEIRYAQCKGGEEDDEL